jgi:hypothetical protein
MESEGSLLHYQEPATFLCQNHCSIYFTVFKTPHIICTHPTTGNNFPSVWHPSHTNWIILHTLTFDRVYSRPAIFKMTVQRNDTIAVSLYGCMTTKKIHKCPLHGDTKGCMKQLYMDMNIPHFFKLQWKLNTENMCYTD